MTEITQLEARRNEVSDYQASIEMYKSIAATLPSEWPSHLAHLKGSTDKHNAIAGIEDLEEVELVSDLWAYDDAQAAIRANTVEKRKAEAILAVLEAQAI